ncbi:MAG: hypothetical protein JWM52_103 [Candidatus Saccharibacteria bacterium]|nr:hypothetical protein [Candidatus Saccharibacteria bacterium]
MRKSIGATLALALVVTGLVATSPAIQADASVSWPLTPTGIKPISVATNGGDVAMFGCDWDSSIPNFVSVVRDNNKEEVAMANDQSYACGAGNKIVGPDGTIYLNLVARTGSDGNVVVAIKNGHIKWTANPAMSGCSYGSSHDMGVSSLSIGDDGNLYLIANENWHCDYYIMGFLKDSGIPMLTPINIGNNASAGSASLRDVKLWTYDSYMLTVDPTGVLRKFSYAGVEDTGASYDFSALTSIDQGDQTFANSDGRVFYVSRIVNSLGSCVTNGKVFYHDSSGSGNVARTDCGSVPQTFTVGGSGNMIGYAGNQITSYDVAGSSVSYASMVAPSGYTFSGGGAYSVYQDSSGDYLALLGLPQVGTSYSAVIAQVIDGSTGTPTNIGTFAGSSSYNPYVFDPLTLGSVSAGNSSIYAATANSLNFATYKVLKFDYGSSGFTGPESQGYGFSFFLTSDPEYVALGDSYSSGEGVEPFLPGTAVASGTYMNTCHRSEDAYPILLDQDPSLGLNLKDFVACSGAVAYDIDNAKTSQWGEVAQKDVLSSSTDVVTITIGGNDILFGDFAYACATTGCDSSTDEYADSWDVMTNNINAGYLPTKLQSVLTSIATKLTSGNTYAQVLVIGYPHIVTKSSWDADVLGSYFNCGEFSSDDATAAEDTVDELNSVIDTAVTTFNDNRFTFVDPNATGSPFIGHDRCNLDPYFNDILIGANSEYSLHPNQAGQEAYAEIIEGALN